MREGVREQPHRHRPPGAHARGDGPPAARRRPRRRGVRLPAGHACPAICAAPRSAPASLAARNLFWCPRCQPLTLTGTRAPAASEPVRQPGRHGRPRTPSDASRARPGRSSRTRPAAASDRSDVAAQVGRAQLPYGQGQIGRVRRSAAQDAALRVARSAASAPRSTGRTRPRRPARRPPAPGTCGPPAPRRGPPAVRAASRAAARWHRRMSETRCSSGSSTGRLRAWTVDVRSMSHEEAPQRRVRRRVERVEVAAA